jgi:hypothetical protein
MQKIRDLHTESGRLSGDRSVFYDGEDLEALIDAARDTIPTQQRNGRLRGVIEADHDVGWDNVNEEHTNVYTVVTYPDNDLLTAHPGESTGEGRDY